MSNLIAKFSDEDSELRVITFYGGAERGPCIQLSTVGPVGTTGSKWGEAVELDAGQVRALSTILHRWLTSRKEILNEVEKRRSKEVRMNKTNEKLDELALRFDTGLLTSAEYLAEITKVVGS